MYIVYVIQHTIGNDLYIGYTNNLENRLKSHNANLNRATKRKNGNWILIYAEAYRSTQDARRREKKLKQHGSSKHELMKRIAKSLIENKSEAG